MVDSITSASVSRQNFYRELDGVNSNNSTTDESLFVNNSTSNPIAQNANDNAAEIAQKYGSQFGKIAYLIKEGQIDEAFALKDELKAIIAATYPNCDPETVYDKAFAHVNGCTPEEFIESSEFKSIGDKGKADGRWLGYGALFGFDAPTKDEILAREYGVELSDSDKKEYERQRMLRAGLGGAVLGVAMTMTSPKIGALIGSVAGPFGILIGIAVGAAIGCIAGLLISHKTKDDFSETNSEQPEVAQEEPQLKSASESIEFPEEIQAQQNNISLEEFSTKEENPEITQEAIEETIENVAQENFNTTLDEQTVENIAQEVIIEDVPEVILEEIVEDKIEEEIA